MQKAIKQTISTVKTYSAIAFSVTVCGFILTGCKSDAPPPQTLTVNSSDLVNGQTIATEFTADGANISPSISWSTPTGEAPRSYALIVDDPDAPNGDWIHWVIYDIPASQTTLSRAIPKDALLQNSAQQGKTSFKKTGYGGPQPPPGKLHHYYFTVYALDIKGLPNGLGEKALLREMEGHIVGSGKLMGTYERVPDANQKRKEHE